MPLLLKSLSKSVDALRRSVNAAELHMDTLDKDMQETVRAGVIQNFEVAYEQCWKMMQRWIRKNKTPEDADNPRTRKDLFRIAARNGLLKDPVPWFEYGESRNLSSHTYNEDTALSVYETAKRFISDAEYLLGQLEKMND